MNDLNAAPAARPANKGSRSSNAKIHHSVLFIRSKVRCSVIEGCPDHVCAPTSGSSRQTNLANSWLYGKRRWRRYHSPNTSGFARANEDSTDTSSSSHSLGVLPEWRFSPQRLQSPLPRSHSRSIFGKGANCYGRADIDFNTIARRGDK